MKLSENQKRDYALWYKETPDQGFSPEHNKAVIEESIRKARILQERRNKDYIEQVRERSDAVASFLKFVDKGGDDRIERFLGRKMLAHLRGEKIKEEIIGRSKRLLSLD